MNDSAADGWAADADPFRVIGLVVAKHRVLRLIGAGAMGAVYEGEHVDLGEHRALKFCRVHAHPSIKQRAVNEAKIGASVHHPAICSVYDFDWGPPDRTTPVVVMELLQGRSLLDAMIESRRLPWEEVFRIMATVCDGLEAAHAQGVVHRDIKPDNIFLTPSGPKIVDFGIAKLATMRVTRTGMRMGTPLYCSPEQVTNSKSVDARSDLYSCGVVLYHAISGQRIFPGRDGNGLMVAILSEQPRPFHHMAPDDVPDHAAAVVDRCIAKEPGQRYPSARALKAALEASLSAGNGPRRASSDERTPTPPPSETPMAQLRQLRDPAAPREFMLTAPGKAAPHLTGLSGPPAHAEHQAEPHPAPPPYPPSAARAAYVSAPAAAQLHHDRRLPVPTPARTRPAAAIATAATSLVLVGGGIAAWTLLGRRAGASRPAAALTRGAEPRQTIAQRSASPALKQTPRPRPTAVAPGHVRVVTTPVGATVVVAGHAVGRTPIDVDGPADTLLRIHVELPGYVSRDEEVMPSADGGDAEFFLKPVPTPASLPSRHKPHTHPSTPNADPRPANPKPAFDEDGPVDPFQCETCPSSPYSCSH